LNYFERVHRMKKKKEKEFIEIIFERRNMRSGGMRN
jgi:hypothetical protein